MRRLDEPEEFLPTLGPTGRALAFALAHGPGLVLGLGLAAAALARPFLTVLCLIEESRVTDEPVPEQTDNSPRPEDGPQDVSQSPDVDLSRASA